MDFKHGLVVAVLFLFSTLIQSADNPGIAFVHGTNDHRADAYGIYWKIDFIERLAQGLANPENYFVIHCNYSKYMWDEEASGCTADQLLKFIKDKNITSLTLYTHSNGGNVIRWMLSNPTYDIRYMQLISKIKQVIALAPSSAGTPLADLLMNSPVISTALSWLLGYAGEAVKQQRVGDMFIYNQELLFGTKGRPPLPKPFKAIIGTSVFASPFSSSSYCNGYLLNAGLKLAKLYLDNCADGFLSCQSQEAAGEVWFHDTQRTQDNNPLSHNQSRHSCFGLERLLIGVLNTEGTVP